MDLALQYVPVAQIEESPLNPRTAYAEAGLAELAADIALRGVLQPVLVRETPGFRHFELIVGHRRLRASRLAGLELMPAIVREMTDVEVLETQLVENAKRADLHALEVAAAYKTLRDKHGLSATQIGGRVGVGEATVRATLKLNELAPKACELFRAGKLVFSTALLVARIPDGKLQEKAAKEIADGRFDNGPLSFREASNLVQRAYMLELKEAPFDRKDPSLVPAAGACTECPRRTGAQPDLFKDVKGADVCTDLACFKSKSDAFWARKVASSKDEGAQPVLTATESKKIFGQGYLAYDAPYLDPERVCSEDPKRRTYKQLFGGTLPYHSVLARAPDGKVHTLIPREGLRQALAEAGHDFKKGKLEDPEAISRRDENERDRIRRDAEARTRNAVLAELVKKAEAKEPDLKVWRLLAKLIYEGATDEMQERRGLEEDWREKWLPKLDLGQLRGVVLELSLGFHYGVSRDETLKEACELFKVDRSKVEAQLREQAKAAKAEVKPTKRGKGVAA